MRTVLRMYVYDLDINYFLSHRKYILHEKVSVMLWRVNPSDVTMIESSSSSSGQVCVRESMHAHLL